MISQDSLLKILGIAGDVNMDSHSMASSLNVTFYPKHFDISNEIKDFSVSLRESFKEVGVNVIPYEESIEKISFVKSFKRFLRIIISNIIYLLSPNYRKKHFWISRSGLKVAMSRFRIKKGISVIVLGEQKSEDLPMQYIYNFKYNSIVTIVDFPDQIKSDSDFEDHFKLSLSLFAYNMSNIIIGVQKRKWILYNFNGSHTIYDNNKSNLSNQILDSLIPKLSAPISPYTLGEFNLKKHAFNVEDDKYKNFIEDFIEGGKLFELTKLFPAGVKLKDLPFRNDFHKWIGSIHLDKRNGMSYGFLSRQLPVCIEKIIPWNEMKKNITGSNSEDFFWMKDRLYVKLTIHNQEYGMRVPDVWVLSQRSGSSKTNMDPTKDLLKLGLKNGEMYMETPIGSKMTDEFKPSFDTKLILAHAVGNAIIASVFDYFVVNKEYVNMIKNRGIAICHWHGYFERDKIPSNVWVYGQTKPHVSCSSPQSAVYALEGKITSALESLQSNKVFSGDIHIEPHHGININYSTITSIAEYLTKNPNSSVLGNKYLELIRN